MPLRTQKPKPNYELCLILFIDHNIHNNILFSFHLKPLYFKNNIHVESGYGVIFSQCFSLMIVNFCLQDCLFTYSLSLSLYIYIYIYIYISKGSIRKQGFSRRTRQKILAISNLCLSAVHHTWHIFSKI